MSNEAGAPDQAAQPEADPEAAGADAERAPQDELRELGQRNERLQRELEAAQGRLHFLRDELARAHVELLHARAAQGSKPAPGVLPRLAPLVAATASLGKRQLAHPRGALRQLRGILREQQAVRAIAASGLFDRLFDSIRAHRRAAQRNGPAAPLRPATAPASTAIRIRSSILPTICRPTPTWRRAG